MASFDLVHIIHRWHGAIAVGDFKKGDQVLIAKQLGVVDSVNLDQLEKFWWVYK